MKKNILRFLLGFCLVGVMFLGNGKEIWADPFITCGEGYHEEDGRCIPESIDIGDAFKIKGDQGIEGAEGYENVGTFLSSSIIPNVMLVANIILFFMIFASGFTIISGAGNPEKQKQASQTLTASIIGFIVIFGAYWIMEALGIISGFNLGLGS